MPTDIFQIRDTFTLIGVLEQITPPATYLLDTFFPRKMPISPTQYMAVEFRKEGRMLAPFIVPGSKGIAQNRGTSESRFYRAPMIGVRRVIGQGDVELRMFGEQPVYSTMTPSERALKMQAEDMVALMRLIMNRKNKMAADILQTGKTVIRGYSDDNREIIEEEIDFEFNGTVYPSRVWSDPEAEIYSDIKACSERIQENTGEIPHMLLCGKNVERKLLANQEIREWLMIPNRTNLAMASFEPRYTSPLARYVGTISALGIDIYSYAETFIDDDGVVKPFLDPDVAILAIPGRGSQMHGAITLLSETTKQFETYLAEYVPVYHSDFDAQQMTLDIYSRFLLVPAIMDDYCVIRTEDAE